MSELDRVRELLAFHAQGVLRGDDLAFMKLWLERNGQDHPEITAELAWLGRTFAQLQAQAEAQTAATEQTSNAGLATLMERIALEKKGLGEASSLPVATLQAHPEVLPTRNIMGCDKVALGSRIVRWFHEVAGIRSPPLAFFMTALLIGQASVIVLILAGPPAIQTPLGAAPTGVPVPQVQRILTIAFRPQATESAIRTALANSGAQIVAGPSALGIYTVAVPNSNADIMETRLRAAVDVVESVQR